MINGQAREEDADLLEGQVGGEQCKLEIIVLCRCLHDRFFIALLKTIETFVTVNH